MGLAINIINKILNRCPAITNMGTKSNENKNHRHRGGRTHKNRLYMLMDLKTLKLGSIFKYYNILFVFTPAR